MKLPRAALFSALLALPGLAQISPTDLLASATDRPVPAIRHYRPDGTLVRQITAGTGRVWLGVARTPAGDIVCTRSLPRGVNVFDRATGAEVASFDVAAGQGVPLDVSVFSDGTLALGIHGSGEVLYSTPSGTLILTVAPASMVDPNGSHVDFWDELWVSDITAARIYRIDRTGALVSELPLPFGPSDLVRTPDGTLWIADGVTPNVHHYDAAGTALGGFPTNLSGPSRGLALAADGTLLVTDPGSSAVCP
jgi:sugar lactone lactonase YvrE